MVVKCPYCNKEFKNTHGLAVHCGIAHPNKPKPEYDPKDAPMYGKKLSPEARKKVAESKIGKKNPAKRPEVGQKISKAKKGKSWEESMGKKKAIKRKKDYSKDFLGERNPNWHGSKVTLICDYCGKKFKQYKSEIKGQKHHFCSKECHDKWRSENIFGEENPNWRGGKSFENYPKEFYEKRLEVLERDNYKCQMYGMTQEEHLERYGCSLHVHHIDGNKDNNDMNNLVTLCTVCNTKIEYLEERPKFKEVIYN